MILRRPLHRQQDDKGTDLQELEEKGVNMSANSLTKGSSSVQNTRVKVVLAFNEVSSAIRAGSGRSVGRRF